MSISRESFIEWVKNEWGEESVNLDKTEEICVNSPFVDDVKHHMWCNTEKNAYHCWKSGNHGSLVELVSKFNNISIKEAFEKIKEETNLEKLEQKLIKFIKNKKEIKQKENKLSILPEFINLQNLKIPICENYLNGRKINSRNFYFAKTGRYKDRIIIPYFDFNGKLIFINGRTLNPKNELRYLGPPKELGVGKGDVVFMTDWKNKNKLYITEGEFDAITLWECGYNACALGGKTITNKQLNFIIDYDIVFCFDSDKWGLQSLYKYASYKNSIHGGFDKKMYMCSPPKKFKDWNKTYVEIGKDALKYYISKKEEVIGWDQLIKLKMNNYE